MQVPSPYLSDCCSFTRYDIPVENFELLSSHVTAIGISGNLQYYFYAQVDESMRIKDSGNGRSNEEEMIDGELLDMMYPSRGTD